VEYKQYGLLSMHIFKKKARQKKEGFKNWKKFMVVQRTKVSVH